MNSRDKENLRRRIAYKNETVEQRRERNDKVTARRSKNVAQYLLETCRNRAKKKNIPFNLSLKDIQIPDVCPVFGTPFVRNTRYAASLDRIKPELGYVIGNIQVISSKANAMKQDASEDELRMFNEWLSKTLKLKT